VAIDGFNPARKQARMISRSPQVVEPATWQRELRDAYRDPLQLLADLDLNALAHTVDRASPFAFRVTRAFAARMRRGDAADPLLRQVLPLLCEREARAGFVADPLAEHTQAHGALLHKYHGRVLLIASGACAINCRYCFRREFPYGPSLSGAAMRRAFSSIATDSSVEELILSGGDPLVLDDTALADLIARADAIAHLTRLRLHTRLPIVLPTRITQGLCQVLRATRLRVIVVVHCNHAQEIDDDVRASVTRLREADVTVLNQAVLLRGVNADLDTLAALSNALFDAGVLPYYMNVLDRVRGTAHFACEDPAAAELERALRARLPGYLVPRFVREVPAAPAKLPLAEAARYYP
jgi:EF-P beta-lysylation protein EpmB